MTTGFLAVIIGPFELIGLFILLAAPLVLTFAYVFFRARFKRSSLDIGMAEAKLLSELAQMEAESASEQNEQVSSSTRGGESELSYALQTE